MRTSSLFFAGLAVAIISIAPANAQPRYDRTHPDPTPTDSDDHTRPVFGMGRLFSADSPWNAL
jgi:hypothetical protein